MHNEDQITVSFVIPAYNEQDDIADTLDAIRSGDLGVPYEIVVVDHESTDDTAAIAHRHGASVVTQRGGTVSSVRNTGVMNSRGRIIVFLDADISVTPQWFERIGHWLERLQQDSSLITGSVCTVPENGNWLERYWFGSFAPERVNTKLGTGHMILTRELFDRIGGFDVSLATGEDYEFCKRAMNNDASLMADEKLLVVHRDYPANSIEFIRREAWHGTGDSKSLTTFLASRVAILALVFSLLHLAIPFSLLLDAIPDSTALYMLGGIAFIVTTSSIVKFRRYGPLIVMINAWVYYLYFIGRSISLVAHDIRK